MTKLSSLKSKLSAFTADESGATLIEYGVIVALILAVSVVIVKTIGKTINTRLTSVNAQL